VGGSGCDDEFPGCASGFHRGVRFGDLIEAVDAVDRYDGVAVGDRVQEFLQGSLASSQRYVDKLPPDRPLSLEWQRRLEVGVR
jgi:hypothetical protein